MLRRRVASAIVMALMCLLVGVAFLGTSSSVGNAADSLSAVELEEMQFLADRDGISLQEASARYLWQNAFSAMADEVRALAPDSFASAKIVDFRGVISFLGDEVPAVAQARVDSFLSNHPGVKVDIKSGQAFTQAEASAAVAAIYFALLKESGVIDALAWFDAETATIEVQVFLSDPEASIAGLQAIADLKLVEATRADIVGYVSAKVSKAADGTSKLIDTSSTKHMGGEFLDGGGSGDCTSGFAVSTSGGTEGILTTGHCPDDGVDDDNVDLALEEAHEGYYGDFQWYTGDHPTPNRFYGGSNSTTEIWSRNVTEVGTPKVGQQLCKNGITTHKSCDDIRTVNLCLDGHCYLIQMEGKSVEPGDSGGPVYSMNTAFGIVTGYHFSDGLSHDLYSRADQLDNALGLYILTD